MPPLAGVLTAVWILVLLAALPVGLVAWVRIARKEHSSDQARRQAKSEDRKGVVARVMSWVQSCWLQPDGSTCQEYLIIAVATLIYSAFFALCTLSGMMPANVGMVVTLETLVLGLMIASLVRDAVWRETKLLIVRRVLLQIAFQKCHCPLPEDNESTCRARGAIVDEYGIIISDPTEPENVGKPIGKGYCAACEARGVLEDQFPGAIEREAQRPQVSGVSYS